MTKPPSPPDDAIEWISQRFYESLTADQRAEIEQAVREFIIDAPPGPQPVGIMPSVREIAFDFAHGPHDLPVARINPRYRKGSP